MAVIVSQSELEYQMTNVVPVEPELIRWAVHRSGMSTEDLSKVFPKLSEWQAGVRRPTLKQLEDFAKRTMTPFGYLFLAEPPVETLPIPDFRTVGDVPIEHPSPNLIDTIQDMVRRQAWMRDELIEDGRQPLHFVSSGKNRTVAILAKLIRETLELPDDWAERKPSWEDALRTLRESAERIGILVAVSSVVGLNNHRPLDPQEFRGFVLCDNYAPLVFVNGADARSAQMFTLAHELAHVWLGQGGLFNLIKMLPANNATEKFCNQVAAEFLIAEAKLKQRWAEAKSTEKPFQTVARWFKVSPVVAARRALDLGLIDKAAFFRFYNQDQEEWKLRKKQEKEKKASGPNFYVVQDIRLGRSFASAVVRAAREGRLPYRDAYRLTGLKGETFDRYADILLQRLKDERR